MPDSTGFGDYTESGQVITVPHCVATTLNRSTLAMRSIIAVLGAARGCQCQCFGPLQRATTLLLSRKVI